MSDEDKKKRPTAEEERDEDESEEESSDDESEEEESDEADESEDEESEEFDMPEAIEFRYRQRLDENGLIPPNALMIARQDVDGMGRRPTGPGRNAGITNLSWTPLGPDNIGGRIRSIIVHPTISTTMWLGAVGGGGSRCGLWLSLAVKGRPTSPAISFI